MTKAIRMDRTGGPEVLRLEEIELGPVPAGHATVRHGAIGVNFIDTYHRSGLYALPSLPHGLGTEGAGTVEAVAPDVRGIAVGQRVAYVAGPPGSYAEARHVPADRLVPLPDDVDVRTAAAIMLRGMTVEYLVRRTFRVEPGMTVVFHAAAGGVGLLACQWLSALGATVIGTVGTDEKAALARAHGCHHVVVYTREDVAARVREITDGRGVPVVYDSVGRATFQASLSCLARRGMLVAFGNASGKPDPIDPLVLSQRGSLYLTRPTLHDYTATREELLASSGALFEMVRSGRLRVDHVNAFPLAGAADAHRALEGRQTVGSTILVP